MQHLRSCDPHHPFPELCRGQKIMAQYSRAIFMPSSPFPVFVTYQKGDTVHGGASKNALFVLTLGPLCSASPRASLLLPSPSAFTCSGN